MRRPLLALTSVLVLVLAGCGDDGSDDEETGATTTTEAPSSSASDPGDGSTTTEGPTTTAEGEGPTTTAGEGDLPGEPIDIYPYEGAHLGVVGVAAGDTLNVRTGPGTDFDVVTELNPLSQEPTATGRNRTLDDDSLWVEVTVDDETGWVNGAYVAEPGAVVDVTADVPAVSGATVVELAEAIAAGRAGSEEGPQPTVTVVAGPDAGDEGEEVTVDVIGLADDAQKGERLLVVAAPATGGDGYSVVSVEAIALCARGVTADGLCL
jgi:uncharacterized protein YraI